MTIGVMDLPPEGMLLSGVALADDPERGTPITEGLDILFTAAGITVQGPRPTMERLLPWPGLDAVSCREHGEFPDGRVVAVMRLTSGPQTVDFLLPAETVSPGQAAYLMQALPMWLSQYREPAPIAGTIEAAPPASGDALVPGPADAVTPASAPADTDAATIEAAPPTAREPDRTAKKRGRLLRRGEVMEAAAEVATTHEEVAATHEEVAATHEEVAPAPASDAPNRRTLVLLVVLLIVVVGGGITYLTTRSNNSITSTSGKGHPIPAVTGSGNQTLASAVNLRQSDLPQGWAQSSGSSSTAAIQQAEQRAAPVLATCLAAPATTVAGLFGGAAQPGQVATAVSPTFQSPLDPNTQMGSTTTVLKTVPEAQFDSIVFTQPDFVSCFGKFQTAVFASVMPGATAQVAAVTLSAPAGVQAFGYLTTVTVPGHGSQIVGDAYIVGGRIETTLQPTTDQSQIPSSAFVPAYNAVVGRVAANIHK